MKLIHTIGIGECTSCGANAPDVALYLETTHGDDEGVERQCCRMCAYKQPWLYGGENTRAIMETILYVANVIRMDLRK